MYIAKYWENISIERRMSRTVMVLFDSLQVRSEAFQYAMELAKRMDYGLVILILIGHDTIDANESGILDIRAREVLRGPLESARLFGLDVDAEIRIGDPSSELIKFCAVSRSIQIIVWGGSPDVVHPGINKSHWFAVAQGRVGCSVVVPSKKP
jgi:hypothetical protein